MKGEMRGELIWLYPCLVLAKVIDHGINQHREGKGVIRLGKPTSTSADTENGTTWARDSVTCLVLGGACLFP